MVLRTYRYLSTAEDSVQRTRYGRDSFRTYFTERPSLPRENGASDDREENDSAHYIPYSVCTLSFSDEYLALFGSPNPKSQSIGSPRYAG